MITTIGPYYIRGLLCETKLSRIYKVHDPRLSRVAALKLALEAPGDPGAANTVRKEADILSRLSHPHILALYDQGEFDRRPYMVTELVEGHSLVVERGQAPDMARILDIVIAVADALSYLHKNNILHLDIKAENILLDSQGSRPVPKLCDFGMSLIVGKGDPPPPPHKRIGGTAAYMAPEHALGRALDGRADLYSLGVVLFELVTGEKPFYGATPTATAMMHVQTPPPRPASYNPDIPPELEAFILKALAKNPDHRFSGAKEFAQALLSVIPGLPTVRAPLPVSDAGTHTLADAAQYLRADRPDRTAAVCRQILDREPKNFQCLHLLGMALCRQGRLQAAIRHFQSATALNDRWAEAHNSLGQALAMTGQNDRAITAFENALKQEPGHLAALLNLGRQYNRLGQPESAEAFFQSAMAAHPSSLAAYNGLAHIKQVLGKTAEAIALFEKAVALVPDRPEPHYNLGTVYFAQQQPAAAKKSLATAIALKPGFAAAHHLLGKICLEEGNAGQAVLHLESALAADPHGFLALCDLGRAYRMDNDLTRAASAYKQYLQFAARDTAAYLALAEILEQLGENEKAVQYRNIASELNEPPPLEPTSYKTIA